MPKKPPQTGTRGDRAIRWIEKYCRFPTGPDRGERVRLTDVERATVYRMYDDPSAQHEETAEGRLAAYVALLHTAGPEALGNAPLPPLTCDPWTVWSATGPELQAVLKRKGEAIICPELHTQFPRAA